MSTTVTILIPTHYSSLQDVPSTTSLILLSNTPGILWHILHPLIFDSSCKRRIIRQFLRHFPRSVHHDTNLPLTTPRDNDSSLPLTSNLFHKKKITLRRDDDDALDDNDNKYTTILMIPPTTITSPLSSTFPRRLIHLENQCIRLQTLNAYVATLGGGYFLCRYLTQAISLARYQRRIAKELGDWSLVGKCTVNEAYNYIHAGLFREAMIFIDAVMKDARARGDEELIRICQAARRFGRRVDRCGLKARGEGCIDNWQRVRVVEVVE